MATILPLIEREWLTSNKPLWMHSVVANTAFDTGWESSAKTKRKRVLFGIACCRLYWPLILADARLQTALVAYEAELDWDRSQAELDRLLNRVSAEMKQATRSPNPNLPPYLSALAEMVLSSDDPEAAIRFLVNDLEEYGDPAERAKQAAQLIREIVGNPYRPTVIDPAWRTETVLNLANQIYQEKNYSLMPILADAIQDANCEDDSLLDHLRGPGPHVKGCWAIDLILGK